MELEFFAQLGRICVALPTYYVDHLYYKNEVLICHTLFYEHLMNSSTSSSKN